jgi:glycosyltransferase involved in cell wall biosynthesis
LGRIHNDKGLDTLCEALKILDLKDKKIQFSLAGEGEDFDSIKKMYDGSVFHENITINWLGYQKNTKYFFESLDLLIYPSRKEGFALVLLEAWERGLPVLTSDIPPFIEAKSFTNLIEQKLIFTMGDVPSLKEKLELFVSHPKEFINFEQKMFLHNCIQENFSQTTMAKKYKQLFESLTNKSI